MTRTGRGIASLMLTGLVLLGSAQVQAQVTGTRNIPGDYPDLAAAITDVNTNGVGAGGATLNLLAGNPQTTPAGGYAITGTGAAGSPLVVNCNSNTITAPTPQTAGNLNDAIFKIIGADFVTISNCVMNENAGNTTTTAASNNMTEWGVALLYATVTDGAQNVTLSGNVIDLNRTYQNTFGIYANATHSATAVTTTASATGAAGGNSGLQIFDNNITDVNIGILVVGPTAAADHNDGVDIGGSSAATGNTITNYGTTATFSSYANVSGTVNGILVRNSRNHNVSFNTVESSNGGTTVGTLRGIFVVASSTPPVGTFTNNINNNSISVRSAVAAGAINGIAIESTSGNATSTANVNNNNFHTSGHTVAGTGSITFMSVVPTSLNTNINGNTFTNLTVNTTGTVILISNSVTHPANAVTNVNNNSIVTQFSKTGAGGTLRLYDAFGSSTSGSETNNNNNFSNVTMTGATIFGGWRSADGATPFPTKIITNNTITNITGGTSAMSMLDVGFSSNGTISGNLVANVTAGAGTSVISGITSSSGTQVFSGNTVHSITNAGTGQTNGMAITGATNQTLTGNKIYNIENTNAAPLSPVAGIQIGTGTLVNVSNNLIGDLRAPNASLANAVVGINLTSATAANTINVAYNTVRLQASSIGANFGTSAVSASSTPTVNLNNNALVNLSTAAGTGVTAAYRRSSTTLTTYGNGSNNNDFFAGTPGAANVIFTDGTNSDQTLDAYKARVSPRDAAAITESPTFISTSGASADFLHLNAATPTQLESGGAPVAGITVDFDGNTRNATTPDIGADEINGIPIDVTGPVITYTPLGNTTSTGNRTVNATINDPSGVAGGANGPRIYFRKNAGAYVSTQCAGAAPAYTCTIDALLLLGVTAGDTVNYFVIAQDTAGNVSANPGGGLVASNVNTVTTPPTTPAAYNVVAPFPTSVNVGTGEAFTSLTNAGGLFEALNNGVVEAAVTATITTDLVAETGAITLNPINGGFALVIRPSGARTVAGASAGTTALLEINGADNVTIDGLNTAGNSLLIRNTTAAAQSAIRYINDASNNVLTNSTIESGGTGTAIVVSTGIATGNDNITISNNLIRDRSDITGVPFNGLASISAAPNLNTGLVVSNNRVMNFNNAGILIGTANENVLVTGNEVFQTATRTTSIVGIFVTSTIGTNLVSENRIHDLQASGTSVTSGMNFTDARGMTVSRNRIYGFPGVAAATGDIVGIQFTGASGTAASVTVVNNFVALAPTSTAAQEVLGIFDFGFGGNTFTADYNTIYIAGTGSGSAASWGLVRGTAAPTTYTARNNLVFNNRTGGTGNHFAGGDQSANSGTFVSNFNFFAGTGSTPANYMDLGTAATGTAASFATWQAGPPTRDANSVTGLASAFNPTDLFVDVATGDLHLKPTATAVLDLGTPIAVTTDIDGQTRSATTPDIGADEVAPLNTAPTITAVPNTRRAGDAASNSTIANVLDAEQAEETLSVTVNGAGSATVNNVTVSGISVSPAGVVTADVVATCSADNASFTLRVTDSGTLFNEAMLAVTVDPNLPPVLSYNAASAVFGQNLTVNPATGPSDTGTVTGVSIFSAGTYTGGSSVNNAGVVSLTGAAPIGSHTIVVRATDNCKANTDANLQLTVGQASTLTTITSDMPEPSVTGTPVLVTWTVTPVNPGAGTPTGTVTVSDGVESCNAAVAVGQCSVALTTIGPRTLTATYSGDTNFAGSSDTEAHEVISPINSLPTISAVPVNRRAGDPAASATIANVNDADQSEESLIVTVNGSGSATTNSVTVSGIAVSPAGVVSANVVAACGASSAGFTLRVTDAAAAFAEATLNVTVVPNLPPVLSYNAASAVFGQNLTSNPATGPSDSGGVSSITVFSPGTYTGTVQVDNSTGVVSLTGAAPVGSHTITIRARDNCNTDTDAPLALTVAKADTTTTITSDQPDPSASGQNVVVTWTVAAVQPGAGTPTGDVTVSDGVNSCTAAVASGQCTVALNTVGNRTLTATYAGDASFNGSSDTEAHVVSPTADLSISKSSSQGAISSGLLQFSIVVGNAGPSAVTGATVTDTFPANYTNVSWSCVGVNGGTCNNKGTGNISQLVNLPVGASVVFSTVGSVPTNPLPASVTNTATVAAPAGVIDPALGNNSVTHVAQIVIFKDGFEDPVTPPAPGKLMAAPNGGFLSLPVDSVVLDLLAVDHQPVEVVRYQLEDSVVILQTRRLGGEVQAQVLQVNPGGSWTVSDWIALRGPRGLVLDWANGSSAAQRGLPQTRLREATE